MSQLDRSKKIYEVVDMKDNDMSIRELTWEQADTIAHLSIGICSDNSSGKYMMFMKEEHINEFNKGTSKDTLKIGILGAADCHLNVNQEGSFLNDQQKDVKNKIMEDLMKTLDKHTIENKNIFNEQSYLDLITTIITMFNIEVLETLFTQFPFSNNDRRIMMNNMFDTVKSKVNYRMKVKNKH